MAKRQPKQTPYERSEAYAKQVSGEIIGQIKKGTAPWMKPWKPGEQIGATNVATGKAYTGGNSLYLMSRQISEGRETTGGEPTGRSRRRAVRCGGERREHKSCSTRTARSNRRKTRRGDPQGQGRQTIYEKAENVRPVMRQYTVFNVEQTDGLKLPPRISHHPGMGHAPGGR